MLHETDTPYQGKSEVAIVGTSPLEAIERASIDMQIATAHRFPRTLSRVKQDMLSFATLDEETATSCFYTLPRGGKAIQGPSVRLAEIAVSCYGNLRAGSRVIHVETEGPTPHVVVQAVAHDLEKNVAITIEKRRRITKKRGKDRVDEDDITLAANAGSSIAFRDAVFKVVPSALIKPVYDAAKKVAVGEATSLAVKRTKVLDRLKQMSVTEDRILAVVDARKVEDITLEKLEILIGLGTALKDGDTTVEEAFPVPTKPDANKPLFGGGAAPAPAPQSAATAADGSGAGATPPQTQPPAPAGTTVPERVTFSHLVELIARDGLTQEEVTAWARREKHIADLEELGDLPSGKRRAIVTGWDAISAAIKAARPTA